MMNRLRFVVDVNVLVSALLSPLGKPRRAISKVNKHGYLLLSEDTIIEAEDVLQRDRFDKYVTPAERQLFWETLVRKSILVEITESIKECRDPKDDKYLELAVSGEADYIISGDTDLLVLNPFRDIPVVRPAEFLEMEL